MSKYVCVLYTEFANFVLTFSCNLNRNSVDEEAAFISDSLSDDDIAVNTSDEDDEDDSSVNSDKDDTEHPAPCTVRFRRR